MQNQERGGSIRFNLEQFKKALSQICKSVEDLAIENDVCHDLINASMISTPKDLQDAIDQALLDQKRRKKVHDRYAKAWQALECDGVQAFGEDLLANLPPTDRLN